MNKHHPYSKIGKTMGRLASRNENWRISKPTGELSDPIRLRSKNRLNRTGKNLAKKGVVKVAAK